MKRPLRLESVGELGGDLARVRAEAAPVGVTFLYSVFVPADRMCLSVVDAPDAAAVLEALRRGGLADQAQVLPAVRFDDLAKDTA